MYKLKTKSSVKKRFRKTAKGHFLRSGAGKSHLLGHKSSKRKRRLSVSTLTYKGNEKEMSRCLPYA